MADNRIVRKILINSYSKDELVTLATDITGNAEGVFSDGGTIETKARELVEWCSRRKKIQFLIDQIKKDRLETYKDYEQQLEEKSESPLESVRSAGEGIKEIYGELKSTEIRKENASTEDASTHRRRHPLAGRQSSIHSWFEKLKPDEQVFVVSAALFSELQRDELMYLYMNMLKALGVSKDAGEEGKE